MKFNQKGSAILACIIIALVATAVYLCVIENKEGTRQSNIAKQERQKNIYAWIGGEHVLRKMAERTSHESSINGNFFLFVGVLSGESKTVPIIAFSWLMNDKKTYQISTLTLTKTRVTFADVATPRITFYWSEKHWSSGAAYLNTDIQRALDDLVDYVVITCKESDWKQNIQLPLN